MIRTCIQKKFPAINERADTYREYLSNACTVFVDSGLADPKFIIELTSDSDQKFWACISEALIFEQLCSKTFGKRCKKGQGPDFLVMNGTGKVWIEVICPEPSQVSASWLNPQTGEVVTFPYEEILLRWTSAIKVKAEMLIGSVDGRLNGYLKSGVVAPNDIYVIAINGCQLRSGNFPSLNGISQFPFAAEAVFSIGPYQIKIDRDTLKAVDGGHQHRPYVLNKNGSPVPAFTFLDPRFNPISAIWAVDLNGGVAVGNGEPKVVVHNPNAMTPLPLGFLPADDEYVAVPEGDEFIITQLSDLS